MCSHVHKWEHIHHYSSARHRLHTSSLSFTRSRSAISVAPNRKKNVKKIQFVKLKYGYDRSVPTNWSNSYIFPKTKTVSLNYWMQTIGTSTYPEANFSSRSKKWFSTDRLKGFIKSSHNNFQERNSWLQKKLLIKGMDEDMLSLEVEDNQFCMILIIPGWLMLMVSVYDVIIIQAFTTAIFAPVN